MARKNETGARRNGSVLLLAIVILVLIGALAAAQVAVQQKNLQQSASFLQRSNLHSYAENGVSLAVHDLRYGLSGDDGKIGTRNWTPVDDVGRDGLLGTGDEGEGDGIPTPGEPNVTSLPTGPGADGTGLVAHVFDTPFSGIQRIVATTVRDEEMVTVEHYVRRTTVNVPRVSALFIDPDLILDLKGNSFTIDGRDYEPDGDPGPGPALHGLATEEGDTPGDNATALLAQIAAKQYDQVLGEGGEPAVGEGSDVDVAAIFDLAKGSVTHQLAAGTYNGADLGDLSSGDLRITYVDGDLHLSGKGEGAGVLLVDGPLTISGQFTFYGLVLARGDVSLTGGGHGVHIYGSFMAGPSSSASDGTVVSVSGQSDVLYSSTIMDQVQGLLSGRAAYESILYEER